VLQCCSALVLQCRSALKENAHRAADAWEWASANEWKTLMRISERLWCEWVKDSEKDSYYISTDNPLSSNSMRGWSLKGQKTYIYIWTARQGNHDLTSRFCCYRFSTLFNYNRYSCTGPFFDLIKWLKDYFLFFKFVFICNFLNVNYFSFLDILGLVIHHFWWKDYFSRTPGSYRYTNSIELVPRFGLWPSRELDGFYALSINSNFSLSDSCIPCWQKTR